MLDETTCPVCGKELGDERISLTPTDQPIWAVAHYLAHLVQQNQRHHQTPMPGGLDIPLSLWDKPVDNTPPATR